MTTPSSLLSSALRRDPSRPLVTSWDETRNERLELSVATVANWVAKIGNAMLDEWGLDAGDSVALDLPCHWTGLVCALAAWSVGADVVDAGSAATAAVRLASSASLGERELLLTLAPMGLDLSGLVASWPDTALADPSAAGGSDEVTAAEAFGLPSGARVLSVLPFDRPAHAVVNVAAPLLAGGSVIVIRCEVMPAAERLEAIGATERATHCAGIGLGDLPRIC